MGLGIPRSTGGEPAFTQAAWEKMDRRLLPTVFENISQNSLPGSSLHAPCGFCYTTPHATTHSSRKALSNLLLTWTRGWFMNSASRPLGPNPSTYFLDLPPLGGDGKGSSKEMAGEQSTCQHDISAFLVTTQNSLVSCACQVSITAARSGSEGHWPSLSHRASLGGLVMVSDIATWNPNVAGAGWNIASRPRGFSKGISVGIHRPLQRNDKGGGNWQRGKSSCPGSFVTRLHVN